MRLLLLALLVLPWSALAQEAGTVKIGNETKKTKALVMSAEPGDIACYLTMKDEGGVEFMEMATFDVCEQKPSVVGKRVALTYEMANVLSPDCAGNLDCKKRDRKAIVKSARIVN